jgi:CO/xanthine dehydrogenase FAD-binding subunit
MPAQERLLHRVLGVARRAQQPVGDGLKPAARALEQPGAVESGTLRKSNARQKLVPRQLVLRQMKSGIEYIRFSSSSVVDKPSVGVAVRLTMNGESVQIARIVLGCVGPTPVRARRAEALLTGNKPTADVIAEAAKSASQECNPTSDLRGSEQYKRAIVGTLVKRALGAAYEKTLVA